MQYICWDNKRMPEFKYLIKHVMGTDYYLANDVNEAYAIAVDIAESDRESSHIIQRDLTGNGDWKSKIITTVHAPDEDPVFGTNSWNGMSASSVMPGKAADVSVS